MMGFRTFCRFVSHAYRRGRSSPLQPLKPSLPHPIESASSFSTYPISPAKTSAIWRGFSRFLMFGSLSTVAGIGYVSYAYTREEVAMRVVPWSDKLAERAKNLRKSAERDGHILGFSRPFIPFASFTISIAARAITNYLSLRFAFDEVLKDLMPLSDKLLPDPELHNARAFTLVLDLNETLVHSDWKDELKGEGESCKRPGFDAFLERLYEMGYELVLYTDEISLAVTVFESMLKNGGYWSYILTYGSNKYQDGKGYRDLSRLNRDPSRIIYVSGHALENCLQHENCVPIKPWKKEANDTSLTDLLPFSNMSFRIIGAGMILVDNYTGNCIVTHLLTGIVSTRPDDIRTVLSEFKGKDITKEFVDRSKYDQR